MTTAVLYPTDPRSDVMYQASTYVNEPTVTIVGGADLLSDADDSTYVQVETVGTYPYISAPRFSAHLPPLTGVDTITGLTINMRAESIDDGHSFGDPRLSYRIQIFRYYPSTTMPDPYQIEDTVTLANFDNTLQIATTFTEFPVTITPSLLTPEDLASGELWFRYQWISTLGERGLHRVSELSLTVEYDPVGGFPLRQFPRDDGLRRAPGRTAPTSRQASLRRGPRGNYA